MDLSLFIAKRYLFGKKSHNAINIITLIAVAGVSIGTLALVVVLSAFNGISGLVFGLYNVFDPDIKITPKEGKTFVLSPGQTEKIKKLSGVVHYTEVLQENGLLKYDDKQVIASIKGVSGDFVKMTRIDTVTREGEFLLEEELRGASIRIGDDTTSLTPETSLRQYAVLGYMIARKLNVTVNDFMKPLEICVPKRGHGAVINPEDAFNIKMTEVSGIFSLNDDFDSKYCLVPISLARTLLDRTDEVSAIEIGLRKGEDKAEAKARILSILGDRYDVKTRYEQNELLFKTINSEKWWTFLILCFILVIATFNVIGSLTMLILEKKKDIRTLRFMGADRFLIRKIFMREGMMITLMGAVTGLLLGLAVCWVQIRFKPVPFSDGFIVDAYPVAVKPADLLVIFGVVMLIGFFAAWYPVRLFTRKGV